MPSVKKQTKTTTRRTTTRRVTRTTTVSRPTNRPMIDPISAIKRFWTGYFDFMGRSTRSEFWFGAIFAMIINMLFTALVGGIITTIVAAILFIPLMALTVRRFRDAGISVWWYLIPALLVYLVPIIRGAAWYRMLALEYVSSGMVMYSFFFMVFGVFIFVVGCLPSRK